LTGDFVLAEIAGILNASIRRSDAVLRYGGDEFLILLADTTASGAETVVKRIDGTLDDWNAAGNLEDFSISVSIGIAEWHEGDTLDEMLDAADRRMYEQKNNRL
jgi:diguanylate cyclase (GGDEF)-like protein